MAKIMDPILPILFVLGYWAIILGSFGGPGIKVRILCNWVLRPREMKKTRPFEAWSKLLIRGLYGGSL